jgi:hypothetical protein
MKRVTNFSDRLCFWRKVTVTRPAYKLRPTANRKNDLGQIRRKGNYAIDFER